ncbi:MAG: sugar transferase [Chitinophagaceae bacterium]|nr:sugar transferase [Chitinophagaceae bacterium]
MYQHLFKDIIDRIFAFVVLTLSFPLLVIICLLLLFFNKGNVFFLQQRPGYKEQIFTLVKFSSMTNERDADGNLLPDELRLTQLGKFLRKTSLDELLQLWNVLKGDMSIVGPRPLLISYLSLYSEEQKKRHHVKPGITGWAQVNGRNSISWQKKFEYDIWYAENVSLKVDVKIILLSLKKVLLQQQINQTGEATASPFTGNKEYVQ